MKYIEKPAGSFVDRAASDQDTEPVDVVMLTLDAENFLEKCLYSLYKEVPVRKLFICDGGSHDQTHDILEKFPRIELFVRPDFRTTGKTLEFLISQIETDWCIIIDSDIILAPGWYDEMSKSKSKFDVIENSKMVNAFHMYREVTPKLDENERAYDMCHLAKKSAIKNFHCDDDYMWRFTDLLLRQAVEKSGSKYGKTSSTMHFHNETERLRYKSDSEKAFEKVVWHEPEFVIVDKKRYDEYMVKHAMAIVKYLDPNHPLVRKQGYDDTIRLLDRQWVVDNGPAWLGRYDKAVRVGSSLAFGIKKFIRRHILKPKQK